MSLQKQLEINELLKKVFAEEAALLLNKCETFLTEKQANASAAARYGAAFRIAQTMAVSASELGCPRLASGAKAMRDALDILRIMAERSPDQVVKLVLETVVALKQTVATNPAAPVDASFSDLCKRLRLATEELRSLAQGVTEAEGLTGLPIVIDTVFRSVARGPTSKVILTSKELQIMTMLETAPQKTMHRNDLVSGVWGDVKCCSKTFGVHMLNLRRKIAPLALGIRFTPPDHYSLVDIGEKPQLDR